MPRLLGEPIALEEETALPWLDRTPAPRAQNADGLSDAHPRTEPDDSHTAHTLHLASVVEPLSASFAVDNGLVRGCPWKGAPSARQRTHGSAVDDP
jgi:hypothetical protein